MHVCMYGMTVDMGIGIDVCMYGMTVDMGMGMYVCMVWPDMDMGIDVFIYVSMVWSWAWRLMSAHVLHGCGHKHGD